MEKTSQLPRIPSASEESPKTLEGSSRGRKGNNNNKGPNQKKKVPQRGMGVFQLEVLRVQETLKKMHQSSSSSSSSPLIPLMSPPFLPPPPPPLHLLHTPTPMIFNAGMVGSYGFGAPVWTSESHHCDVCLKKKRFNEDSNKVVSRDKGFDIWTPMMNAHDFLADFTTANQIAASSSTHRHEFAEVVAVHRNGKVLMEYGFFPGKDDGIRSTTSKELPCPTLAYTEPEPSPITAALGDTDTTTASTCVDLSLKLSY